MNIVNLTPHQIKVINEGETKVYLPSGIISRVEMEFSDNGIMLDGITVVDTKIGNVINYPNKPGEIYIVSTLVGLGLAKLGYENYVVPNTNNAIRDDNGQIIAVPNFMKYVKE